MPVASRIHAAMPDEATADDAEDLPPDFGRHGLLGDAMDQRIARHGGGLDPEQAEAMVLAKSRKEWSVEEFAAAEAELEKTLKTLTHRYKELLSTNRNRSNLLPDSEIEK